MTLASMGDRALRFTLPTDAARRPLLDALRDVPGVADVILAEDLGCVVAREGLATREIERGLRDVLASAVSKRGEDASTTHAIDVAYDGEDLMEVAAATGMSREAVIATHSEREYGVAMVGFMPGFAYLRGLDPRLVLPRRARPRPRVPEKSVAIGAEYTGVYPYASPGGWHLLGRALDFAPLSDRGATVTLGDRVRFTPVAPRDEVRPVAPAARASADPAGAFLEITSTRGIGLLVDGGRPGHMHEGVPRGGLLAPSLAARANAAAGNAPGACAVELMGTLQFTARGGTIVVGDDTGKATRLAEGEAIAISTEGRVRVRYLAVEGGVDVPVVLGGRGTLLVAGIGGIDGRVLRLRDRLVPSRAPSGAPSPREEPAVDDVVAIVEGPDEVPGFDVASLYRETFRVSTQSDRTGTRLDGPPLAVPSEARRPSAPMVLGAIELTSSGLIVMGPDHPTTGGYPVVGVVASASLESLAMRPLGSAVRFRRAGRT